MTIEHIFFFDDDEKTVPKEKATQFRRLVLDDQGNRVLESFGKIEL